MKTVCDIWCFRTRNDLIVLWLKSETDLILFTSLITLEWAQKQFVIRVCTLFHFFHDVANPKNDNKNDDIFSSSSCLTRSVFVLLMTSQSIADDVTMTRQLWRDHANSDIWVARYRFYSRRYSRPIRYFQFQALIALKMSRVRIIEAPRLFQQAARFAKAGGWCIKELEMTISFLITQLQMRRISVGMLTRCTHSPCV